MKKNIYKIIALSLLLTPGGAAAEDARTRLVGDGWFEMPFRPSQQNPQGEYIYFVGGYNSEDRGTPPWGSLVESENLFIGDRAGEIVIAYADGTADVIPLIFGYTMWFKANWRDGGAPFKTEEAEPAMTACLRKALQLQGGFEGNDQTAIKVKIQSKPIREIRLADNPRKAGEPVFDGGYLLRSDERKTLSGGKPVDAADPFFDTHTIDSRRPDTMRREIERIRRRLYTFESDFKKAPAFKYPETYERARISFTGNRFADILTQVYYYNVEDILTKMRDDGMIDESSPGAPSWRYDGFGTWVPQANSYCGAMYSRNRALGILSYLDLLPKTQKSVDFLHKCLMYYPDNGLTMLGKRIPGHWSVIPNKPMEYSKVLVPVANWPTQYTKELFGDDYQNFGNSEPDGHGLTMMSIANVWRNGGADPQWVLDNWTYVNEAVHYIDWAMKNPDISFNKNGLMYGETEAAMMDYTMFANIPCYLGVRMYVEMAQAAGKTREATAWTELADRMERAILDGFSDGRQWNPEKFGFFHDPSMSIYADYVGYDVRNDAPAVWYSLCDNTYRDDLDRYIGDTFFGPRGLGYDHNIITQTSMLLDRSDDYDRFLTNLSKLCYSPRLPKPFIVPEGASYSREQGMYRRQGDLGNFVQQNETVRTILMAAGTSKAQGNVVKVMPRLPKTWSVDVNGLTVPGSEAKISYRATCPENNVQTASFSIENKGNLDTLKFRAGPFTCDQVTVNGTVVRTEPAGDARWAWITVDRLQNGKKYTFNIRP